MDLIIFISTIIIIIGIIYIYFNLSQPNMTYVKSDIDNEYYLVRDVSDKINACNLLAKIKKNILLLSNYLYNNIDNYPDYKEYIALLHKKAPSIVLIESTQNSKYTSYSINKGEQIVFCLRTKNIANEIQNFNLIMYVVLHEISHVACPIYDNHGPLFKKIFAFLTEQAIKLNIYTKIDFNSNPENYCGMMITDSII